jgi:hypothetical protein
VAGAEKGDIYVIAADGGAPRMLVGGSGNDVLPSWSPDGASIFFTSDRGGHDEIWTIPANGGSAVQLTKDGGFRPISSPDGKFVYYAKLKFGAPHGAPLWRIHVDSAVEEQVFETPVFHPENFDIVGDRIFYSTAGTDRGSKVIREFDLTTGADREVASIGTAPRAGLSVSRDRTTVLFSHADFHNADLVMFDGL